MIVGVKIAEDEVGGREKDCSGEEGEEVLSSGSGLQADSNNNKRAFSESVNGDDTINMAYSPMRKMKVWARAVVM